MSDPVREAFEAWAREHPADINLHRWDDGEYRYEGAAVGWDAWQASRAAALEEAAKACEERGAMFDDEDAIASIAAELCASRIRAMVKP